MDDWKVDVAVLLIFFNRPDKTFEVFNEIKKAKPSRLYLYQDGPRGERDLANIFKCREIVSQIDWKCEVHKFYQESNVGCDPSEFIAQKWMFATEEMGIILEDDDVPSQSFFPFCAELLLRYKNDNRINMICGMNNIDYSKNVHSSYFFSKTGSIWGWASWKRVVDTWDEHYSWLDNKNLLRRMKKNYSKYRSFKDFIKVAKRHRASGRAHYESINGASRCIYNRLNIVPCLNMIRNIGISSESTHSTDDVRILSKRSRSYLCKETFEIDFPLKHPIEVKNFVEYEKKMRPSFLERVFSPIGRIFNIIRYKGVCYILKKIKHKVRKK